MHEVDCEAASEQPDRLIGATIEKLYVVQSVAGRGGMGTVYSAKHLKLDKKVALKFLQPRLSSQGKALNRFTQEARLMAQVRSPNAIEVFSFGITEYGAYIAEEWVDGIALSDAIGGQPMERERAIRIFRDLCNGIKAAHDKAIIHRDLKPQNVMLGNVDGRELAKITDFGIAVLRTHEQTTRLTSTGQILGTLSYMAPEQLCGQPADERSDIFSLGCILFEMLTGEALMKVEGPADILKNNGVERIQSSTLLSAMDKALLVKLVAPKPAERASSIDEVLALLAAPQVVPQCVKSRAKTRPTPSLLDPRPIIIFGALITMLGGVCLWRFLQSTEVAYAKFDHDISCQADFATLQRDYENMHERGPKVDSSRAGQFLESVQKRYSPYSNECVRAAVLIAKYNPDARVYPVVRRCAEPAILVRSALGQSDESNKLASEVMAVMPPLKTGQRSAFVFAVIAARCLDESGDKKSAKKIFEQVLRYGGDTRKGERMLAHIYLGKYARESGDLRLAVEHHLQAHTNAVNFGTPYLVSDLYLQGDADKGHELFNQWIQARSTTLDRKSRASFEEFAESMLDYGDTVKTSEGPLAAASVYEEAARWVFEALQANGQGDARMQARASICLRMAAERLDSVQQPKAASQLRTQSRLLAHAALSNSTDATDE